MTENKTAELVATPREVTGKATRFLRRDGWLPGNIYGQGKPSTAVQVDAKEFDLLIRRIGSGGLMTLLVDGKGRSVMVREIERNQITRAPIHVSFQEVNLNVPIKATVPIVIVGESDAVKGNVMMLALLDRLNIEGLPAAIPTAVHADAAALSLENDSLYVRDLQIPEGITVHDDPDEVIAKLAIGGTREAEEEAEVEEGAEVAEETPAAVEQEEAGEPSEA